MEIIDRTGLIELANTSNRLSALLSRLVFEVEKLDDDTATLMHLACDLSRRVRDEAEDLVA